MKRGIGYFAMRGLSKVFKLIGLEKSAWNIEHKQLHWQTNKKSKLMIEKISSLLNGGVLIEFGCGDGTLPGYLSKDSYSRYIGYDISSVAVSMCESANKDPKISFQTQDMSDWRGLKEIKSDLIVCEECLNYLDEDSLIDFLRYCCESLDKSGAIFASFHSHTKHANTIKTIRQNIGVSDEFMEGERIYMTLKCGDSAILAEPPENSTTSA